jgi:hypothetical protein
MSEVEPPDGPDAPLLSLQRPIADPQALRTPLCDVEIAGIAFIPEDSR